MRRRFTLLIGLLATSAALLADTVVLKDGSTLDGRITAQDATSITLEIGSPGGLQILRTIATSNVARIEKEASITGPSYVTIPVYGEIGSDFSPAALKASLAVAREKKPTWTILLVDSPGGQVMEMMSMIDLMAANSDLNTVAFVRNAYSAAAILAMCCDRIYMHPDASIGGAVPFVMQNNIPREVGEKFASIIRAKGRFAAENGGHNSLFVSAMMDSSVELHIARNQEGPSVTNSRVKGSTVLKPRGQILTLTAAEAVDCGLACGRGSTLKELRENLGIPSWQQSADTAGVIREVAASTRHEEEYERHRLRQEQAREYELPKTLAGLVEKRKTLAGQILTLQRQIADARATAAEESQLLLNLETEHALEIRRIDRAFRQAMVEAALADDSSAAMARAKILREADLRTARDRYETSRLPHDRTLNALRERIAADQANLLKAQILFVQVQRLIYRRP